MKEKNRVDPAIRDIYEENPYDPLASARMLGRFLGSILAFDRKMNPLVMIGSIVIGAMFLIPGLISGNVFAIFFGMSIVLNVIRNVHKYYFPATKIKAILIDAGGVLYLKDDHGRAYLNPQLFDFIKKNQAKYVFGVISDALHDLESILKHDGIRDLFQVVVTSGLTGLDKSQPQIYQLTLEQLELQAEEVLLIDNLPEYIDAARRVGLGTILYSNFPRLQKDLVRYDIS